MRSSADQSHASDQAGDLRRNVVMGGNYALGTAGGAAGVENHRAAARSAMSGNAVGWQAQSLITRQRADASCGRDRRSALSACSIEQHVDAWVSAMK